MIISSPLLPITRINNKTQLQLYDHVQHFIIRINPAETTSQKTFKNNLHLQHARLSRSTTTLINYISIAHSNWAVTIINHTQPVTILNLPDSIQISSSASLNFVRYINYQLYQLQLCQTFKLTSFISLHSLIHNRTQQYPTQSITHTHRYKNALHYDQLYSVVLYTRALTYTQ